MTLLTLTAACGNAGDDKGDSASDTTAGGTPTTSKNVDLTENVPVDAPGVSDTEIHVASVTSRQFVDALKATGPTAGRWIPPIDWTRQHADPAKGDQYRSEFECLNFLKVENSKFVPYLAEPAKPWNCWDGHELHRWQEPVHASFEGEPFTRADLKANAQP